MAFTKIQLKMKLLEPKKIKNGKQINITKLKIIKQMTNVKQKCHVFKSLMHRSLVNRMLAAFTEIIQASKKFFSTAGHSLYQVTTHIHSAIYMRCDYKVPEQF